MSTLLRRMLPAVLLTVASAGGLLVTAGSASADSPVVTGWWSEARPGNATVGTLPQDPTYTDDGTLVVRNTPAGVAAFAALRYVASGSSGGTLTLDIADNKSVEAPALVLCPTTSAWSGGGNQQWDHAPTYDCSKKITGQANGSKVTWTLNDSLQAMPGTFDFVVVPDPGYQTPFEVTIAKPSDASFTATGAGSDGSGLPANPVTDGSTSTGTGAAGASSAGAPMPALSGDNSFAAPPTNAGVAPSVAGPEAGTAPSGQGGAPVVADPTRRLAASGGNHDGRTLGIGLIVGLALVLLVVMANPGVASSARRFHHPVLAAMGGGAAAAADEGQAEAAAPVLTRTGHPLLQGLQATRAGGVGRFVRDRPRPPVRL